MPANEKTRIILAEDDESLGAVMTENLQAAGYDVKWFGNGSEALDAFYKNGSDLLLLDVMMPKMDGFSMAETVRKVNPDVPIIFLTAKSMKEDKIIGFQIGADDYITKPFSLEELQLRIEAVMKRYRYRAEAQRQQQRYRIGDYIFDYPNVSLTYGKTRMDLTQKEADLLRMLCLYRNEVLKRDTALKAVWGESDYFRGRSMDVFITRLRKYLSQDDRLRIENVHGVGFRLVAPQ
jgi:DNA-binding response OmpR family regulator